ncbi:unnamed protein product [Echinostoma caproni]|uniref:Protein kinase domain-containing protein n=1 Tax=Echinostoma caproni TaxID=27848 RepID=A0A183ADJ9_9TREM|nr:unnamed protein product [Echinostoma caproni]
MIKEEHVKIWLHRDEHTILVGIRPQLVHDRQEFEMRLETHKTTSSVSSSNSEKQKDDAHKRHTNGFTVAGETTASEDSTDGIMRPTESWPTNVVSLARSIHTVYLKQFTIHFGPYLLGLIFQSNRTDPYLIYDPNPLETSRDTEVDAAVLSTWNESVASETNNVLQKDDQLTKDKFSGLEHGTSTTEFASTDLLLTTLNPDPMTLTEAIDELAIRLAQSSLISEQDLVLKRAVKTMSRTSQSLLIPSEPTGRTLVHVVPLDEVVQFTCEGHVPDGQLRILYDRDAWRELSPPQLSFHSVDGSEQLIRTQLRTTRVTWSNVTQTMLDRGLRDLDALTNVKCGSHQASQLIDRSFSPYRQTEKPVEILYFVTVNVPDFQLIEKYVRGRLSNLFHPIRPVVVEDNTENFPILPLHRFIPDRLRPSPGGQSQSTHVGFWNLSLSSLSNVKLVLSVIVVTLVVSFIVLLIRNYSRMRPIMAQTPVVPQWMGSGEGDAPNPLRQKHFHLPGRNVQARRRGLFPGRAPSMTNSNAFEDDNSFHQITFNECFPSTEMEITVPKWYRARRRKSNSESTGRSADLSDC